MRLDMVRYENTKRYVLADYLALLNGDDAKAITVKWLDGYDQYSNVRHLSFPSGLRCTMRKLRADCRDSELFRVNDGWMDPIYDVEPMFPGLPELQGLRNFWCYGICYRIDGPLEVEAGDLMPGPMGYSSGQWFMCCDYAEMDRLEDMVHNGFDVDTRDMGDRKRTALHQVVQGSWPSRPDAKVPALTMAQWLLDHQAIVNAVDTTGLTPTDIAANLGNEYMFKLLRARGGCLSETFRKDLALTGNTRWLTL